jgi:hypothetical protein
MAWGVSEVVAPSLVALLLTFGTAPVWIVLATGAALVAVGYRAAEALVGARDGIAGARAG